MHRRIRGRVMVRVSVAAVAVTAITAFAMTMDPPDLAPADICAVNASQAAQPGGTRAEQACLAMQEQWSAGEGVYAPPDGWSWTRLFGGRASNWSTGQAAAARIAIATLNETGQPQVTANIAAALAGIAGFWDGTGYVDGLRSASGTRYFDDNSWDGLDLMNAYAITGDQSYLDRAKAVMRFVDSGWSTDPSAASPGGTFWVQKPGKTTRHTVSTAGGAQLALRLYAVTGQQGQEYLDSARRMVGWVEQTLRNPAGLYWDNINHAGGLAVDVWSYNQGLMLGDYALLYQAAGNRDDLCAAQRIAAASVERFSGAGWHTQPVIFNALFFDNLMMLNQIAPDPAYVAALDQYANQLWASRTPGTALIPSTGDDTALLAQAGAVQVFALQAQHASHQHHTAVLCPRPAPARGLS